MDTQTQNRNLLAVKALRTLGFSLPNIRKAMHKLTGITQPDLADRLGISRPYVTAMIDGRRNSSELQAAIADAFGVPVDAIFDLGKGNACVGRRFPRS